MIESARHIYDVLDVVEQRPGMYLPIPSLSALAGFIEGFDMAYVIHRSLPQETPPFYEFSEWLRQKHSPTITGQVPHSWFKVISALSGNDDQRALGLFFALLHEYRGDHPDPSSSGAALRAKIPWPR